MDESFQFRATLRTDDELHERVNNRNDYLPKTVEASVEELQLRGEQFSEEELMAISANLQVRRDQARSQTSSGSLYNNSDRKLQVKDPDAPMFYSKGAIYGFSILFSVLFGSVMLAININQTEKRRGTIGVILYGVMFIAIKATVVASVKLNSGFAIAGAILGTMPLNYLFWRDYLGNDTLYRRRPVWIPLIIALVIFIPLIFLIISAEH